MSEGTRRRSIDELRQAVEAAESRVQGISQDGDTEALHAAQQEVVEAQRLLADAQEEAARERSDLDPTDSLLPQQ